MDAGNGLLHSETVADTAILQPAAAGRNPAGLRPAVINANPQPIKMLHLIMNGGKFSRTR